jgi:hypothetical protein
MREARGAKWNKRKATFDQPGGNRGQVLKRSEGPNLLVTPIEVKQHIIKFSIGELYELQREATYH